MLERPTSAEGQDMYDGPVRMDNFQGVMASLQRLERRILAANAVIDAARAVIHARGHADAEMHVGMTADMEALDRALTHFDREVERIRAREPRRSPKAVSHT
jgi:hypothetical protein